MRILGIDPGSRFLGYGVVEVKGRTLKAIDFGVVKFDAEIPLSQRLLQIGQGVEQLLNEFKPDHLSVEKIFLGKNADSAFKLGHARGVVLFQALQKNIPVYEYATREVKKGITGHGGAEKEHVRLVIQNLLQLGPVKSLDASDALAMACYHAQQCRLATISQTAGVNLLPAKKLKTKNRSGRATKAQVEKLKRMGT